MTLGSFPFPTAALAAWSQFLPPLQHVWAGTLRIWQVETARTTPQATLSHLLHQGASVAGTDVPTFADRVGIVPPSLNDQRQCLRMSVNLLASNTGFYRVDLKGLYLPTWPHPLTASDVPADLCQPQTTGGLALQPDRWPTVPVVRALTFIGAAIQSVEAIHVYPLKPSAGTLVTEPLFTLPANAFPTTTADDWAAAWRTWCDDQRITTGPPPTIKQGLAHIAKDHPALDFLKKLPLIRQQEAWLFAGANLWPETARLVLPE